MMQSSQTGEAKVAFAARLGFESFLALFENSTPVPSDDGKTWRAAALPDGNWVV